MKWKPFLVISFILLIIITGCSKPDSEADAEQSAELTVSEDQALEGIPVEVMIVKRQKVEQTIPMTGILDPLSAVDIVAEVSGKVTAVTKSLGSRVSLTDTLARIDDRIASSNYRQAASQVLSAENNLKIAELNLKSDKELYEAGDISELAFENAKLSAKTAEAGYLSAQANLSLLSKVYEDTRIMSPISGYISRKHISPGVMVNPGMVLYRVVDLSTMKIEVGIPQELIGLIQEGGEARVRISALDNKQIQGRVKYISPQADENTGGFTVEIHVKNSTDRMLLAGMTVTIELLVSDEREQLVVPDYALVSRNDSTYVYRIIEDEAVLTPVVTHKSIGNAVIIDEGVTEGDTIVTVGMKNLGLKTKVIMEQIN